MIQKIKNVWRLCWVEVLATVAFLIAGVVFAVEQIYDAAAVMPVGAFIAGLLGWIRYRELTVASAMHEITITYKGIGKGESPQGQADQT